MISMPETAMILAAGKGTRMRPLTETTAKPLLTVGGCALMDHLLNALRDAGVRRLVVNVHWCADQVEAHLESLDGFEVVLSDERDLLLETGGALAKARPLLGDDPVFVVNTDAFWAPTDAAPLQALCNAFDPKTMDELLLLADTGRCLGFAGPGDFFRSDTGKLERRGSAPSAPWAFAGTRLMMPALYDSQPVEPFSANRLWNGSLDRGRLHGLPLDRFWLHVGDPQALKDAEMWMRCHGS